MSRDPTQPRDETWPSDTALANSVRPVLGRVLDDSYAPNVRRHITTLTAGRWASTTVYRYVGPFLATIASGLDVGLDELGVAIAIIELVGLLSPALGRRLESVPRRVSMTIGLASAIVGCALAATSVNVPMFAFGLIVLALGKFAYDVAVGAWIVDHVPYARRSRVVGLTETSWAFGLLIGVSSMGVMSSLASWRWAYALGGAYVVIALVAVIVRVGDDHADAETEGLHESITDGRTGTGDRPEARITSVSLFPSLDTAARWMLLGFSGLMGSSQAIFVTFGAWLEDDFGFTAAGLAGVTFGMGILELCGSTLSTLRTDRWGKERSVIRSLSVMLPTGVALAVLNGNVVPGLIFLCLYIGAFEFGVVSAVAVAGELVPGSPTRGFGALIGASTLARGIVTIVATSVYERFGLTASALVGVACGTIAVFAVTQRLRLLPTANPVAP